MRLTTLAEAGFVYPIAEWSYIQIELGGYKRPQIHKQKAYLIVTPCNISPLASRGVPSPL